MKYIITIMFLVLFTACKTPYHYFGQEPPSVDKAEVFAPGIISLKNRYEQNLVFSPKGDEVILSLSEKDWKSFTMLYALYNDGKWGKFDTLPFSKNVRSTLEPFYTENGNRLYFTSDKGSTKRWDTKLWTVTKTNAIWGNPTLLDNSINSRNNAIAQFFPSISKKGNLFYINTPQDWQTDIYKAEKTKNGFKTPVKVSNAINSNKMEWDPIIAPDESYMLFLSRGREDALEEKDAPYIRQDIYIAFKDNNGSWREAIHLGKEVNSIYMEQALSFSPDMKYLFFGRLNTQTWEADIYWINLKFIEKYRKMN